MLIYPSKKTSDDLLRAKGPGNDLEHKNIGGGGKSCASPIIFNDNQLKCNPICRGTGKCRAQCVTQVICDSLMGTESG